jgi:uncharacterized membrane protein YoaK (UPF0700 family)
VTLQVERARGVSAAGLVGWLQAVSGHRRTPERNRHLANLLALIAGVLNSVGFVAVGVYTSHMTGLTASVADHLVLGGSALVAVGAAAIVSFVAGAMACAVVFNWARRRHLRSMYANVLLLEALLILVFGALADLLTWSHRNWLFVTVLCFTMGLQNAIITKISQAQIRTTHLTGMVTDIGIELGKLSFRSRRADLEPVHADLHKLRMLSALVVLFFVGGILGAAGYLAAGFSVLLAPAVVLLVAAAPPLVDDLRRGRGGPLVRRVLRRVPRT